MKSMMGQFQWKPKNLRENVESESNVHKARIVGWSALMFVVASSYDWFFQNVTYRAMQHQWKALAGTNTFNDKINKYSAGVWNAKNLADFLDAKDNKDLKYIDQSWKVSDNNGQLWGVQGDPSTKTYWVQTQRYTAWRDDAYAKQQKTTNDPIGASADAYNDWEEMHKPGVMWFDTAGCFNTNDFLGSSLYGHINAV